MASLLLKPGWDVNKPLTRVLILDLTPSFANEMIMGKYPQKP